MHPLIKRFVWIIIFAVMLYTAMMVWGDFRKNLETLRAFPWRTLPLILSLVLVNFVVREFKWDYYRRAAGIQVPRMGSFLVFFSGYSMAISPARAGELIKPFMYKEYFGQKMRRSIPLVFCERVSDLLGMLVLGALTLVAYMHGVKHVPGAGGKLTTDMIYGFLILSSVFMIFLVWFARQKRMVYGALIALSRYHFLRSAMHKLRSLYHRTYPLLSAKNLTITTAMATFSWFFECIAMMKILHGVGATDVTLLQTAFVFCMATIFGGFLFFLPGGLGGFEGSTFSMLTLLGVSGNLSKTGIIITRVSTLFFAVTLGFLFILFTSIKYHKSMTWDKLDRLQEVAEQEDAEVSESRTEKVASGVAEELDASVR